MKVLVIATLVLIFRECSDAITITFPTALPNPMPTFFIGSNDFENGLCKSAGNDECVIRKAKRRCGFTDQHARMLHRLATFEGSNRHPTMYGQTIEGAEGCSKKCICIAAKRCSCEIAQNWCNDESITSLSCGWKRG